MSLHFPSSDSPLSVEVTRSQRPEAFHRVHAIAMFSNGKIAGHFGNPDFQTYFRSSAKPFQLLTVLVNRPTLLTECSDIEIAVMASSHSGEPAHISAVSGLLSRYQLSESMLKCGKHDPYYPKAFWQYGRDNIPTYVMHNNCTGKHTAMLLACQHKGWDFDTYLNDNHPLQIENTKRMARFIDKTFDQMKWGIDGCSVPTWWMSLRDCALAYSRFSSPDFLESDEINPVNAIFSAYHKQSWYTSGTGRFGVDFNRESDGNWLGKVGGEAIFGIGLKNKGIGIVVKVEDGAVRAIPPALLFAMKKWELISDDQLNRLAKWIEQDRLNAADKHIGFIKLIN